MNPAPGDRVSDRRGLFPHGGTVLDTRFLAPGLAYVSVQWDDRATPSNAYASDLEITNVPHRA